MQTIDIPPQDLDFVLHVLAEHLPDREVWAFGSRVGGNAKEFSDLDLAIMGEESVESAVMADLREVFRESDLPFKVDLIDWATTQDYFRRIIERDHVVIHGRDRVVLTEASE